MATKKRNPVIASIFSFLLPGFGQIYNGQFKKGFFFFFLTLFFPFMFGLTKSFTYFYGLIALSIIEISLRLIALIDAFINANSQKDYVLKKYNTWYYHLIIAIGMVAISILYDTPARLGAETFKIPTTSNQPTINYGDWVVGDTKAYINNSPEYGDIVAFNNMYDGQIYCYRIIGLPNDIINIKNHNVTINQKECSTKYIGKAFSDNTETLEFEEELPNGHKHKFYKLQLALDSTIANIDSIFVPSDCYFLLGDNRDNAMDSRYIGFVNKENIIGRIVYSYWGKTKDRININFRDK